MMNFNLIDIIEKYKRTSSGVRTIFNINSLIEHYNLIELPKKKQLLNSIKLSFFLRDNIHFSEISNVIGVADKIAKYIDTKEVSKQIFDTNKKHTDSKKIQDIFISFMKNLGFESEKNNLFKNYKLRPDYFKKIDENDGIILEVERGKTITNNMDIYDLWKCHICKEANHLFLFVPQSVSHTGKVYESTFKRIKSFFEPEDKNFVNIKNICLFGY